jgi:hypothetical protein
MVGSSLSDPTRPSPRKGRTFGRSVYSMLAESTTDDVDGDEQREDDDDPDDPEPGPQRRRGSLTIEINLDADDPPPVTGHAPGFVDGQRRRDQQCQQGSAGVSDQLNPQLSQIRARQHPVCRNGRDRPNRLRMYEQDDRREHGQPQFRDHSVVAK